MCHRSGKPSAMDLPPSCKAAADKMEQALREEDLASYKAAQLTGSCHAWPHIPEKNRKPFHPRKEYLNLCLLIFSTAKQEKI